MCSPSMAESICYFYAFIFLEIEGRAAAAHGLAEQADRPAPLFDYITGTDLPLGNNHGVESASTSAHGFFKWRGRSSSEKPSPAGCLASPRQPSA